MNSTSLSEVVQKWAGAVLTAVNASTSVLAPSLLAEAAKMRRVHPMQRAREQRDQFPATSITSIDLYSLTGVSIFCIIVLACLGRRRQAGRGMKSFVTAIAGRLPIGVVRQLKRTRSGAHLADYPV